MMSVPHGRASSIAAAPIREALPGRECCCPHRRASGSRAAARPPPKRCRGRDILFGKLRPYLAKMTRPERDGVRVGESLVLQPVDSDAFPWYMELLLRSKRIIEAVNSSTFGAKMPRADWTYVGGLPICLPPPAEQRAIVRFLDHADRRIRRYICAKEKLIELQEEHKQAKAPCRRDGEAGTWNR